MPRFMNYHENLKLPPGAIAQTARGHPRRDGIT